MPPLWPCCVDAGESFPGTVALAPSASARAINTTATASTQAIAATAALAPNKPFLAILFSRLSLGGLPGSATYSH